MASHFNKENDSLSRLSAVSLDEPIPTDMLNDALSKPPFINLPGFFNVRDVGAYVPGYVKPRTIFRSGMLDLIPSSDQSSLRKELGLSKIFDFRRSDEIKGSAVQVEGLEVLHCPYMDGKETPPPFPPARFVLREDESVSQAYRDMYDLILEGYTVGYRKAFEELKTATEDNAILFHCTGGKDRTGVMAALILDLMGAPAKVIAEEYALTRIGTEPFREALLPAFVKSLATDEGEDNSNAGIETPGLRHLLSSSKEVMADFVERLRSKYGGAEGYLSQYLKFSEDEIKEIRENLEPAK
ncbi:unnamed protein product [Clonostachys chloroleuca]|uniref:Tyrosine specific protein phosphatases domain-containing protein n=1 Tax=Clonostachys chloroleuca TaxID=1926264 RepID=A0AA35QD41_9HYPO|nr:unnamed protein product [Clonostachys chloroleuca]